MSEYFLLTLFNNDYYNLFNNITQLKKYGKKIRIYVSSNTYRDTFIRILNEQIEYKIVKNVEQIYLPINNLINEANFGKLLYIPNNLIINQDVDKIISEWFNILNKKSSQKRLIFYLYVL